MNDEAMAREKVMATLRDLQIPIVDFSKLQRHNPIISKWQMERVVRGERVLDPYEAEALLELCQELRELAAAFSIPINWSETAIIQNILARRREQARQLIALNSKTPLPVVESKVNQTWIDAAVSAIHPEPR